MPTTCQLRRRPLPLSPPGGVWWLLAPEQASINPPTLETLLNRAHFLVAPGRGGATQHQHTPPLFSPSSEKLSPLTPRQSDPIWSV